MTSDNSPRSLLSGIPVDLPIASSNAPTNPQVSGISDAFSRTNSPPSPTPNSSRQRRFIGPRQLDRLRNSLSPRDHAVLEIVAAHRYLTTRQIQSFCFHDHASVAAGARTASRVLRRLADHGLLKALERRVGGVRAGSASHIWQLGTVGYRLLRADGKLKRTHEPSPRFLAHCLAVADTHLMLLRAQRQGIFRRVDVHCEPESWRSFTGLGGERRVLQPDLFASTTQPRYVDRWFIEVDLGTESLPTLLGKCAVYEAYRKTGIEQSGAGVFPLVIWQLPSQRRLDTLASAIARSANLLPELFRFTVPDDLVSVVTGGTT
ncbi:replication-relaxation family protein [Kribbella sp. NPDC026611]|uniref:replication-relaxation family protein n=1 Tax=Kribbella sp. NPDC026611 TaxID=3154911 RepID=UPI0033FA6A80